MNKTKVRAWATQNKNANVNSIKCFNGKTSVCVTVSKIYLVLSNKQLLHFILPSKEDSPLAHMFIYM